MKPFMVIRDPEAYQLLADETRRKILYLLRVKEMTAGQIAEQLGVTSQAVYHHIKKLLKGNMVEVTREERTGHMIESYYRSTAEDFILLTGKIDAKSLHDRELAKEQVTTVLNSLKKLGFKLEFEEKHINQLTDLRVGLKERDALDKKPEVEDNVWNADDLSLLEKVMASEFAGMLLMSQKEFADMLETRKKLRDLLLSLIKNGQEQTATQKIKSAKHA